MAAIWPAYDEYQASTPREIPVVIIELRLKQGSIDAMCYM